MTITEEKLQIILITYNRENYLKRTLEAIIANDSPVKGCDILVLDNNSSDGSGDIVAEKIKSYPNISYKKNKYNVGLAGNIAKAMEAAEKEYYWIIADDDKYDWSAWTEVENAIAAEEDMIMIARYLLPEDEKDDYSKQMGQFTFVPGAIIKTNLLDDTLMRNVFDSVYTLFPHLWPMISLINKKKKIFVISKGIVDNGMDGTADYSYIRGQKRKELFKRTIKMTWILGYATVCQAIRTSEIREETFINGVNIIHGGFDNFCQFVMHNYYEDEDTPFIEEFMAVLNEENQAIFKKRIDDM